MNLKEYDEGPRAVLKIRWPGRRIAEDLLPFSFCLFDYPWVDLRLFIAEMDKK